MKIRFWLKSTGEEITDVVVLREPTPLDPALKAYREDLHVDCNGDVFILENNGYDGLDSIDVTNYITWDVSA